MSLKQNDNARRENFVRRTEKSFVDAAFALAAIIGGGRNPNPPEEKVNRATISDDERINEAYRTLLRRVNKDRLTSAERGQLRRAIDALARPGVEVIFGDSRTADGRLADGQTDWLGNRFDDNNVLVLDENGFPESNIRIVLRDNPDGRAIDLVAVLAHEGTHAAVAGIWLGHRKGREPYGEFFGLNAI